MRSIGRIALTASIALALSACGKKDEAPVADTTEAAVATDAAAVAALPPAGTYELLDAAGKVQGTTTINADGTYAEQMAGAGRVAGIVKLVDGKTCFDPSGKAPEECFTDSAPAADGSFTATDAKGVVVTVRPKAK
jgi:hypothetical protein